MRLIFGMVSVNERFPVCWRRQKRVEWRRRQEPLVSGLCADRQGRNLTLTDIADVSGTGNADYQKAWPYPGKTTPPSRAIATKSLENAEIMTFMLKSIEMFKLPLVNFFRFSCGA